MTWNIICGGETTGFECHPLFFPLSTLQIIVILSVFILLYKHFFFSIFTKVYDPLNILLYEYLTMQCIIKKNRTFYSSFMYFNTC